MKDSVPFIPRNEMIVIAAVLDNDSALYITKNKDSEIIRLESLKSRFGCPARTHFRTCLFLVSTT